MQEYLIIITVIITINVIINAIINVNGDATMAFIIIFHFINQYFY